MHLRLHAGIRRAGGGCRYLEAFTIFDDIYRENKKMLANSGFVGAAVWVALSAANWAAERGNPAMGGRFDTIAQSSYFTLCNLFGEFPLVNERSAVGKVAAAPIPATLLILLGFVRRVGFWSCS